MVKNVTCEIREKNDGGSLLFELREENRRCEKVLRGRVKMSLIYVVLENFKSSSFLFLNKSQIL
jgi:hypothetical protein